jgi:hypothetical protein
MLDPRTLANALGGDVTGPRTVLAPGPGHGRKDRSLSIKLDPAASDGFLAYSHAGDDWKLCRDYIRERLGWPKWRPGDGQNRRVALNRVNGFDRAVVDAESEDHQHRSADDLRRIAGAVAIWNQAINPRGTLAERYLKSRAIVLTDDVANTVLRFHPACPWRDENTGATIYLPMLIAAFRSIDDDAVTAIQRVALTIDGTKIGRRMLGIVHRAAVKLDPLGSELAVGEGIETCLAARILGIRPAWALGSVGMIAKFPVIEGVGKLTVLGETGQPSADAIKSVRTRWRGAGHPVRVVMPTVGSDLNDVLLTQVNGHTELQNQKAVKEDRSPQQMSGGSMGK